MKHEAISLIPQLLEFRVSTHGDEDLVVEAPRQFVVQTAPPVLVTLLAPRITRRPSLKGSAGYHEAMAQVGIHYPFIPEPELGSFMSST